MENVIHLNNLENKYYLLSQEFNMIKNNANKIKEKIKIR